MRQGRRVLVLAVVWLAAAPAWADDRGVAKASYTEGKRRYDLGEYPEALAAFKRAYLSFEDPVFLFNIALCYRQMGDRTGALRSYRAYLENWPAAPNRARVEAAIAALKAEPAPAGANAANASVSTAEGAPGGAEAANGARGPGATNGPLGAPTAGAPAKSATANGASPKPGPSNGAMASGDATVKATASGASPKPGPPNGAVASGDAMPKVTASGDAMPKATANGDAMPKAAGDAAIRATSATTARARPPVDYTEMVEVTPRFDDHPPSRPKPVRWWVGTLIGVGVALVAGAAVAVVIVETSSHFATTLPPLTVNAARSPRPQPALGLAVHF